LFKTPSIGQMQQQQLKGWIWTTTVKPRTSNGHTETPTDGCCGGLVLPVQFLLTQNVGLTLI
jgi:hypothetical protein